MKAPRFSFEKVYLGFRTRHEITFHIEYYFGELESAFFLPKNITRRANIDKWEHMDQKTLEMKIYAVQKKRRSIIDQSKVIANQTVNVELSKPEHRLQFLHFLKVC
jgi:ribosomal protein S1